jgi:peptidoglycan/xylan/chitin deacetylase (PgdA/CDA1 family)
MSELTIVMYHYVRDLAHARYPEIKGLDVARFRAQLDHIQARYVPITAQDLIEALSHDRDLPERACLLTFDDGYLDHYLTVFPELLRRGLSGAFYPPVLATARTQVMEVNKIHLILAANGYARVKALLGTFAELFAALSREMDLPSLESYEALYARYAKPGRFDRAEVVFVKCMLQFALPPVLRTALIDAMFQRIVDLDEVMLAQELYMSVDMLRVMAKNGMHIGSHGDRHLWLDKLTPEEAAAEVEASLAMLAAVHGTDRFVWSMCYPFGGNNAALHEILAARGCAFAVTSVPEVAVVAPQNRLVLPRLDTNDIPVVMERQACP